MGFQNQQGMLPKLEPYWKLLQLEILAKSQSRDYNEGPVQRVCLISVIIFKTFFNFFLCFASWLATQSSPP